VNGVERLLKHKKKEMTFITIKVIVAGNAEPRQKQQGKNNFSQEDEVALFEQPLFPRKQVRINY
jgi:hypothetical protein